MFLWAALIGIAQASSHASEPPLQATVQQRPEAIESAAAFAQLAQMVGTWRVANKPNSPLRIHFYLTAGQTVLVESWEVRGKPHSLTIYHRDGQGLLATHYCPKGNQPRLALAGRDTGGLHFTFRDATDLDLATESYQHDLWFDLTETNRPVRGETYFGKDGLGTQERLQLVRDSEAHSPAKDAK
jgi:hypothetical protein